MSVGVRHYGDMPEQPELSPRDRAVLEFEVREGARMTGAKEERIRSEWHLSPARYYQRLHRILDDPAALMAMPTDVKRLRRVRAARAKARQSRQFR